MKNDKEKFKTELKKRIYCWSVNLVRAMNALDLPQRYRMNIMAKQLLRSGTSICANDIETQAASSRKDFVNFLHYSLKSANESKFWLTLLRDTGKMSKEQYRRLFSELLGIANILGSSILTIKERK